jgi:chorismate-pyruvate lyase
MKREDMPKDFASPLSEFYTRAGLPLPRIEVVAAAAIPAPYRALLDHHDDMTPTLERFHDCEIWIHALGRERREDSYSREVVLCRADNDEPVEFGAIRLELDLFPTAARAQILEEHMPLGRILRDHGITHSTRALYFLRIEPDELICRSLRLVAPVPLYGRQAVIFNLEKQALSRVVEILPAVK